VRAVEEHDRVRCFDALHSAWPSRLGDARLDVPFYPWKNVAELPGDGGGYAGVRELMSAREARAQRDINAIIEAYNCGRVALGKSRPSSAGLDAARLSVV